MSSTQNRLATGKKVNSALDNPTNFFTSQSLSNRASDLNSLLDLIGQAQKTLKAADKGITSLTKLVESAKSIAKQARQAPSRRSARLAAVAVTGNPIDESARYRHGAGARCTGRATPATYSFDIAQRHRHYTVRLRRTSTRRSTSWPTCRPASTVLRPPARHARVTLDTRRLTAMHVDSIDADFDRRHADRAVDRPARATTTTRPACSTTSARRFGLHARRLRSMAAPTSDHLRHRRRVRSRRWPS